jgi:hypothetical protein
MLLRPRALTPTAVLVAAGLVAVGHPFAAHAEGPLQHAPEEGELADRNFLDASHAFLEDQVLETVLRLDRFFSDERDLEFERSRSFVRWRNELRLDDGGATFRTGLRASLRFPGLGKVLERVRLDIAGQTDDTLDALFPREPGAPAPAGGGDGVGRADAELRFRFLHTLRTHGDLGAGVILDLPVGVFTRARLRWARPLGGGFLLRVAEQGFWRSDVGFGQKSDLDLERALDPRTSLRLSSSGLLHQESAGLEFSADLALLQAVDARLGLVTGVGLKGATSPFSRVDEYRIYVRLRRDFWRRWLFLELEPELGLPRRGGRYDEAVPAVFFRLEVQFRGGDPSRRILPGGGIGPIAPPGPAR